MNTQTQTTPDYIADALVFVHGEMAPMEARRQLALCQQSGNARHVTMWERVVTAVDGPRFVAGPH